MPPNFKKENQSPKNFLAEFFKQNPIIWSLYSKKKEDLKISLKNLIK